MRCVENSDCREREEHLEYLVHLYKYRDGGLGWALLFTYIELLHKDPELFFTWCTKSKQIYETIAISIGKGVPCWDEEHCTKMREHLTSARTNLKTMDGACPEIITKFREELQHCVVREIE